MKRPADKAPAYLFAGGGTGGHLYPAIAIAAELRKLSPQAEIHFAGTSRGVETRIVPELGYPLHLIAIRGFARHRFWINLALPFLLLWSLVQSLTLIMRLRPRVVVGTGGYVSGPILFAAHLLGRPTLIQEQNSFPGVTTRLLARWVDQVHLGFAEARPLFKRRTNVYTTGNPVRDFSVSATAAEARRYFGLDPARPTLLVFGGSQGARVINELVIKYLSRLLAESEIQLIWSSGKWNQEAVRQALVGCEERVWRTDFITEMPLAYRAADVVMSRAGALTLAEIAVCGLPALLIPFAAAAGNHQEANALALAHRGAALVILERELPQHDLVAELLGLINDAPRRQIMGRIARETAFTTAGADLARAVMDLDLSQKGDA
ncbi:MAG TPA: undecaprenyldiphospho-muramoylpentapeptide beta-N-acetylglucosaminyltransferase [bacterium]|nr:undecaprenyldiphospho-muramoylpentapeptide beta-N-acetylglucosaminyltransferase [bacterium]HPR86860.1 undecaprenyldiphospho-muramoylpentapeptide beta-N-acetylglucosaminyltransferase [bacterium]